MQSIQKRGNKFIGMVDGKEVVKSTSEYYVKRKLAEFGEVSNSDVKVDDTPINKRFEFVESLVGMVASGATASAIISGEGGLGKTYSVMQALEVAGLVDITKFEVDAVIAPRKAYRVVKGFSTAKGLYRILAENANQVIVFDDCDSVLKDDNALNILKGALDTYDKRVITWNTSRDDDDIPRWFEFTGGIIFITNVAMGKLSQAVRTRAMCVDLTMTSKQKIERMVSIVNSPDFMPETDSQVKFDALALVDRLKEQSKELSMRTLIKTIKIRDAAGSNWEELAEYMLKQG